LYTVLNVSFPKIDSAEMLLFNLDIAGIACSAGSACSSGSNVGSHVLRGINADMSRPSIRFSFCRFTTKEEIDYTVEKLKELFLVTA
jgi:cysteine desulfurase